MKEIEQNKQAWSLLARDHYEVFKRAYLNGAFQFNQIIERELGDISGKDIIHLQCNTGADSIYLKKRGAARVTGVDLVPENIHYAAMLANDLDVENMRFIESDILQLTKRHTEKYDVVFTSEGVLCWLPDLAKWGKTVAALLRPGATFYIFDTHPLYMVMDEQAFAAGRLKIKYPYFSNTPDEGDDIGGYAAETRKATNYCWCYTMSGIVNALVSQGLQIEFLNEHSGAICDFGNMKRREDGLFYHESYDGKLPMSFSLLATKPL